MPGKTEKGGLISADSTEFYSLFIAIFSIFIELEVKYGHLKKNSKDY